LSRLFGEILTEKLNGNAARNKLDQAPKLSWRVIVIGNVTQSFYLLTD